MNWDAIGAIGEIVGSFVVLITLIYLAQQIKQNTRSQTIATYESAMSGYNVVNAFVAGDVESCSIWRRGLVEHASLNEDEVVRFDFMVRYYTNHVYKLFRLYENGALPEAEWANTVDEAKQMFQSPQCAEFKLNNDYFADLWVEMDSRNLNPISTFEGITGRFSDDT